MSYELYDDSPRNEVSMLGEINDRDEEMLRDIPEIWPLGGLGWSQINRKSRWERIKTAWRKLWR